MVLSKREKRETDLATENESLMLRIACEDFDDSLSDSSCSSRDCDVYHCDVEDLSVWSWSWPYFPFVRIRLVDVFLYFNLRFLVELQERHSLAKHAQSGS